MVALKLTIFGKGARGDGLYRSVTPVVCSRDPSKNHRPSEIYSGRKLTLTNSGLWSGVHKYLHEVAPEWVRVTKDRRYGDF